MAKLDLTLQMIEKFHDELHEGDERANKTYDTLKVRGVSIKISSDVLLGFYRNGELLTVLDTECSVQNQDLAFARKHYESANDHHPFTL
jgi:hypothetical protein